MPEDLLRPDSLAGGLVELLDGNKWIIPIALEASDNGGRSTVTNKLPDTLDLNDAGEWVHGRILPRFSEISQIADRWFADMVAAMDSKQENEEGGYVVKFELMSDIFDAAAKVLSANYAVGRAEVAMLGLLTEKKAYEVLNQLVDLPGLVELQKKREALASCDLSAGPGATP
jgi:hypothetical protein